MVVWLQLWAKKIKGRRVDHVFGGLHSQRACMVSLFISFLVSILKFLSV